MREILNHDSELFTIFDTLWNVFNFSAPLIVTDSPTFNVFILQSFFIQVKANNAV